VEARQKGGNSVAGPAGPARKAVAPVRRGRSVVTRHGRPVRRGLPLRHKQRGAARLHTARTAEQSARQRLQRFRRASILAVALTGILLMMWAADADFIGQAAGQPVEAPSEVEPPAPIADPATAAEQAAATVRDLLLSAYALIPTILVALIILVIAYFLTRAARTLFRQLTPNWSRADAAGALSGVVIFLIALGAALSVIAGDARALVGSVGLAGLALSWALQAPIESFTGWLLNSFQNYYRVGDRIEVGEVFGDVYRIDILTTTVWEAGGSGKAVQGAQPTGALITFPNSDVLRANIINYTREFEYVWDEITFEIAPESDLRYTAGVIEEAARRLIGPEMAQKAEEYQRLLETRRLAFDVAISPTVFLSLAESWVNITVRYLVNARQRRRLASDLTLAISEELARQEHQGRIFGGAPRRQIRLLDRSGLPRDLPGTRGED
jgi:small conductance mechanosensitive channel